MIGYLVTLILDLPYYDPDSETLTVDLTKYYRARFVYSTKLTVSLGDLKSPNGYLQPVCIPKEGPLDVL